MSVCLSVCCWMVGSPLWFNSCWNDYHKVHDIYCFETIYPYELGFDLEMSTQDIFY